MLALNAGMIALFLWGVSAVPLSAKPKEKKSIDFNRDIRPIITKCFTCHGRDESARMAGLRLDKGEIATSTLKDGKRAIVPYHPEESELINRIYSTNPNSLMPPPSSNKVLTDEERATLKQWIIEGAEYKEHWAFVPPVRYPLPPVKLKSWPRDSIDYFILAKLEANGLGPSPEADKRTLIRRVSLDLIGLPPTEQEVQAFLKDHSPRAYEKVVDRLLASPRYGERMAMDWMDYARYADSNGYQSDWERFQYRWRDWVINAFNKNMPYNEFAIEQLAGDLLPHPTLDQIIATGFNRNHRINTEGGVIAEEWRVENVIDRVETTAQTFLGLTAGCARCHDHKFDPLSQKEFYQLCSFFNNVPESGTGVELPVNHKPYIAAPYPEQAKQLAVYDGRITALQAQLDKRLALNAPASVDWKGPRAAPLPMEGILARYALGETPAVTAGSAPAPTVKGTTEWSLGRSTGARSTSDNGYVDLGNVGNFDTRDPFSVGAWINPDDGAGSAISHMDVANDYRGWDLFFDGGKPMFHLIHKWKEDALKVISKTAIPNGQWSHVFVTYDGSGKASGVKIYVNGILTKQDVEVDALKGTIKTDVTAKLGRRTGGNNFSGKIDDAFLYDRVLSPSEVKAISDVSQAAAIVAMAPKERSFYERNLLAHFWSRENDPEYRKVDDERAKVQAERDKLDSQVSTVMIMKEMPIPRRCFVLVRGQYNKHGQQVFPGTPAFLPPMPKGAPNNRLGLAEWIVSTKNPLTARVAVNRMWERLFGTGIVATLEDFGTRAEFPSHPELLDWLATEFVRKGWDMKAMMKELVMSATYRQDSRITPALEKLDPANRLLARGPRFRLTGEEIRDQALAVSGLLVEKIGGPSVRPYQPDGIWDETNVYGNLRNYKHDTGPGLHRRSLYTIWKRTAAPPDMTLFDVPSREVCTIMRARTDTPLQALTLMNDVTYVEASRALAQRMMRLGGNDEKSRLTYGFESVLCRPPSADEMRILRAGLDRRVAMFRAKPKAAKELLTEGDLKNDPKMDPAELAAYTVSASTLLNLDETVTKE